MSKDSKTFTVAGTSVKAGVKSFRFANGTAAARAKIIADHDQVKLFDLPHAMIKTDAIAWLAKQGVDAPIPEAQRVAVLLKVNKVPRVAKEIASLAEDAEASASGAIAHEELGFAASKMSRNYWNTRPVEVRQEMSRNAAWAAGIKCPKGTYPELDAWLRTDGLETMADGTLREIA